MSPAEIARFFGKQPLFASLLLAKEGDVEKQLIPRRAVLIGMRIRNKDGAVTNWEDIEKFAQAMGKLPEEQETRIFRALYRISPNFKVADDAVRTVFWELCANISRLLEKDPNSTEDIASFLEKEAKRKKPCLRTVRTGFNDRFQNYFFRRND